MQIVAGSGQAVGQGFERLDVDLRHHRRIVSDVAGGELGQLGQLRDGRIDRVLVLEIDARDRPTQRGIGDGVTERHRVVAPSGATRANRDDESDRGRRGGEGAHGSASRFSESA